MLLAQTDPELIDSRRIVAGAQTAGMRTGSPDSIGAFRHEWARADSTLLQSNH